MQRPRSNDYGESSSFCDRPNERAGTPRDTDSPKAEPSHSAEIKRRDSLTPHSTASEKYRRTISNTGSARRSESQPEEFKRKQLLTPAASTPEKVQSSTGSARRSDSQPEEFKRKQLLTPAASTPEKVRRPAQGGRFVNSLIEQWVKNTGSQVTVPQPETPGNSSMEDEHRGQDCDAHKHALRSLRKRYQDSQETILELQAWRDNELKLKQDIVAKINANWESMGVITKFSDYVTECLAVFQQKYDSLSALYNDVIITERATIQKLQQKLESIRSKGNDNKNAIAAMEEKFKAQEQQMVELQRDMKKQAEEADNKLRITKGQLESAKAELHESTMQIEKLESSLRRSEESSTKVKEEITEYKSKLDDLTRQNSELIKNIETSTLKERQLAAELESKIDELSKLEVHLAERRKLEIDLRKDLDAIGSKYSGQVEEFNILQTNFNKIQRELEDMQRRNAELETNIENMKTNSESEVVQLNKQIETLKNEYENTLRAERKNEQTQNSKRTKEYNAKISALQDTVATQYSDLTKVKESLEKSCEEKQNLQEKLDWMHQSHQAELAMLKESLDKSNEAKQSLQEEVSRLKKTNEQFENMINAINAKLAIESTPQNAKDIRSKTSEGQPLKEEKTSSSKPNQQAGELRSAKITRPSNSTETTRQNTKQTMSLSQPTGTQKKVRFNISSPEQVSQSMNPFSFSPTTEVVPKPGTGSPNFKFFKSRGTVTKQYGSARKPRGRK